MGVFKDLKQIEAILKIAVLKKGFKLPLVSEEAKSEIDLNQILENTAVNLIDYLIFDKNKRSVDYKRSLPSEGIEVSFEETKKWLEIAT